MEQQIVGLAYRKIDLHIHTPASRCFKDKTVTPTDLINQALKQKLDAIAITDHNSGAWIDDVKKAAKDKIVVFPGVEISSTGGEMGVVHIIALFDVSQSTKGVENLLGDLKIQSDKYGTEEAFTRLRGVISTCEITRCEVPLIMLTIASTCLVWLFLLMILVS